MSSRIKNKLFAWSVVSFFITTSITYVFVRNWFQTMFIAAISVLLEIFNLAFVEKREIIQISRASTNSEEML